MSAGSVLKDREELLDVLTYSLPCLTLEQIARTAFGHAEDHVGAANRWVGRLESKGRVRRMRVPIHPEISVRIPLHVHSPGKSPPDFGKLAWKVKSRWKLPPVMATLVSASSKPRRGKGQSEYGRTIRLRNATHDVHLGAVLLALAEDDAEAACSWVLEPHVEGSAFMKVPDALVMTPEPVFIEFVGSYSERKLRSLFDDMQSHSFRWY